MNKSLTLKSIIVYPTLLFFGFVGIFSFLLTTSSNILHMAAYAMLLCIIAWLCSMRMPVLEDEEDVSLYNPKVEAAWGKVAQSLDNLEQEHVIKDSYLANLITLADCTQDIAMWIKDAEHRYLFADKTLRNTLLGGRALHEVAGKTDAELINTAECSVGDIVDFLNVHRPDWLPLVDPSFCVGKVACNITDIVTQQYQIPCRFFEKIEGRIYDVWKTPIVEDGKVTNTVGCLVDITHQAEKRERDIKYLEQIGEAFRIDSTPHFYIKKYYFGDLVSSFQKEKT